MSVIQDRSDRSIAENRRDRLGDNRVAESEVIGV